MAMTRAKDFESLIEDHLNEANVSEDQQRRRLRWRNRVSSEKRTPNQPEKEGWQTLESMTTEPTTIIGRLHKKMEEGQSLEAMVKSHILLPEGQRLRALMTARGELIVTVNSASAAHQLRYDLPATKPAIERTLGRVISAMKIQVDPNI